MRSVAPSALRCSTLHCTQFESCWTDLAGKASGRFNIAIVHTVHDEK